MDKKLATVSLGSAGDSSSLTLGDKLLSHELNMDCDLPGELIAQILLRLPVKPLLRFKSVSKPWCSLIESPKFAKLHLKKSIECKTNIGMILRGKSFYSVDFYSLENSAARATEIDDEAMQNFLNGTALVGSCNGIVCVLDEFSDIILFNPSIRKCRRTVNPRINLPHPLLLMKTPLFGFGYDHLSDDYKVVRIVPNYDEVDSRVFVYSLKTNSWKQTPKISHEIHFQEAWGVLASGALHWIVVNGGSRTLAILAFDVGVEYYKEIPPPKFEPKTPYLRLEPFGGCLSILAHHPGDHTDVWVIKEYVTNSWSKLLSVKQPEVLARFNSFKPLAYSESGKDVLLEVDNKSILWFDLAKNEVKTISIDGLPNYFDSEVYTESLVELHNDWKADSKEHQERKKKQTKRPLFGFSSKGFSLANPRAI